MSRSTAVGRTDGRPWTEGARRILRVPLCPLWVVVFLLLTASFACSRGREGEATAHAPEAQATDSARPKGPVPIAAADIPTAPTVNGARAMQYVKEIVALGPRPIGSANHRKLEDYILAHLQGDEVADDAFMADTPEGKLPVRNIIAKFRGTKDGIMVIAGHYDTLYGQRNAQFVGANDGGSSTALLLELANQLRGKKREGYSVWLLWTDGEEAIRNWTATDSVYGARHLAALWQKDGTLKKIKAFLVVDMIGDADLNIDRDADSTAWLEDLILEAASHMGYQSHFFARTIPMEDDHKPFLRLGVPSADLIDFDYGYGNVFWHTPQDTVDKLSPKSLEIVGDVVLETVWMLDAR